MSRPDSTHLPAFSPKGSGDGRADNAAVSFRLLAVVAVAVAVAFALILGLSWRHEVARLEEVQRARAGQAAEIAAVMLQRRVERGRIFIRAIAGSRAIQEALAARQPRKLDIALSSFRSEFGAYYLVITDAGGKPLTWSTPLAALAMAVPSPRKELAGRAVSTALIAGDLAALIEQPVEAAGRRLGTIRAGILIGRLFLEQTSHDIGSPLALFRGGEILHHTTVQPPPPPGGTAVGRSLFLTWQTPEESYDVAYLPVDALKGNDIWLASIISRLPVAQARRRYLLLITILGLGGVGLVVMTVGGFLLVGRRRERRLKRQRDEALNRSEGLSDRLAHLTAVVHDIKAPVGGIQLRCEGLAEETADPEVKQALDQVVDTCERLNLYLVNILTAAQAEEGPIAVRHNVLLAPGLIEEVAEHVAALALRKNIRLATDADEDLPPLRGDGVLLERALWNLASNALAATPEGGEVQLFAHRQGSEILLGVRDTGPGFAAFPPEDAFSGGRPEVKNASIKAGSTGLGLFIVRRIAEAHGGQAEARHSPKGGAEVFLRLPLAADVR